MGRTVIESASLDQLSITMLSWSDSALKDMKNISTTSCIDASSSQYHDDRTTLLVRHYRATAVVRPLTTTKFS
jgi:hypothetical protein